MFDTVIRIVIRVVAINSNRLKISIIGNCCAKAILAIKNILLNFSHLIYFMDYSDHKAAKIALSDLQITEWGPQELQHFYYSNKGRVILKEKKHCRLKTVGSLFY